MLKFSASFVKEILLLLRDKSGLAVLFIMPAALVTIMALVQDTPFRDYQEFRIPTILLNQDEGEFGQKIERVFEKSTIFQVEKATADEGALKQTVADGNYEIGILIPKGISEYIAVRTNDYAKLTMVELGFLEKDSISPPPLDSLAQIGIFFRPGVKQSFRQTILSALRQEAAQIETSSLIKAFKNLLGTEAPEENSEPFGNFIAFTELSTGDARQHAKELNSVQHNVPAWTMFGMFFIVISLAGSIIREREEGSYLRILTMPGNYTTVIAGKLTAYLLVCLIQCVLMLGIGLVLLPQLGLPALDMHGSTLPSLSLVAVSCGLAAVGFGVLTGTLFKTQQQASTFGSVSVVILAAVGGIWVPVYVMPPAIQAIANWSPLYWGLNSFQHVFLGNGQIQPIGHYILKLILFFVATIVLAIWINRVKNRV